MSIKLKLTSLIDIELPKKEKQIKRIVVVVKASEKLFRQGRRQNATSTTLSINHRHHNRELANTIYPLAESTTEKHSGMSRSKGIASGGQRKLRLTQDRERRKVNSSELKMEICTEAVKVRHFDTFPRCLLFRGTKIDRETEN